MAVTAEPFSLSTLRRSAPLPWTALDLTLRFNQAGSWSLTGAATGAMRAWLRFDADGTLVPFGVLINWNGVAVVPVIAEEGATDRAVGASGEVAETITFAGADMLALLAQRVAYPDPLSAWSAQTVSTVTKTGAPETVIKGLITDNMISAGDAARNVPGLAVATDQARGGTCTWHITTPDPASQAATGAATVATSLMGIWRSIAAQASVPIGLQIALTGGQLAADCYLPADLSARAVFSARLGNLSDASLDVVNPSANAILLQSNVTAAKFTESAGAGAGPWRRAESFSDQSSVTDSAAVDQAATDAVTQGQAQTRLGATAVDIAQLRFGADYQVGDTVAVDLFDDLTYTDIVSAVDLHAEATADAYTETVTPAIGTDTSDGGISAGLAKQLAALEQQLHRKAGSRG